MNTEIVARCEPIRAARKPFNCRLGQRGFSGTCWVKEPYRAIGNGVICKGCGGLIDPNRFGAPSFDELLAAGIV